MVRSVTPIWAHGGWPGNLQQRLFYLSNGARGWITSLKPADTVKFENRRECNKELIACWLKKLKFV